LVASATGTWLCLFYVLSLQQYWVVVDRDDMDNKILKMICHLHSLTSNYMLFTRSQFTFTFKVLVEAATRFPAVTCSMADCFSQKSVSTTPDKQSDKMDLQETSYSPGDQKLFVICKGSNHQEQNRKLRPCTYATFLIPQGDRIVFKKNKYS
jgi:hypothetical protein